ncbi:DNA-directed DNA polymerase alpha catalytic subunit POL1 PWA37_003117 [Arxiozyma heterogenica]|uniref:DNA-directed DNA polymerase alpha catalytic subunit POL1 n=1 Tax=Arxiozyma heterogenica TaxID=278026 RepID=UPI002EFF77B8
MSRNDRLEKLRRLQAAKKDHRHSGNENINNDGEEDDDRIYDEIDEVEYKRRRRQELLQDDFVVDDDGVGYADRGVEDDWQNEHYYSSEDFEDFDDNSGMKDASINKRKAKKRDKDNKEGNVIGQMLRLQQQQRKKKYSIVFE